MLPCFLTNCSDLSAQVSETPWDRRSPNTRLRPAWIQDEMSIISQAFIFHLRSRQLLSCLAACCFAAQEPWEVISSVPRSSTPAPKTTMYLFDQNSHLRLEKPKSRQTEIGQDFPRKPVWAGGDAFDWQQPRGNRTRWSVGNTQVH